MMLIGSILGAGVASLVAFVHARVWPGPPAEPGPAGMNYFTLTAGTWLVQAPAGAWTDVNAVRRWRRILGEGDGADGQGEAGSATGIRTPV